MINQPVSHTISRTRNSKTQELGLGDFFGFAEFNEEQNEKWIGISVRKNNMYEFGNLIFFQGMSSKFKI